MIITAPVFSLSMIILILGALTVLFIVLEWKKNHRHRALRVLAMCIIMVSLAGIMLRPKYSTKNSATVLLLTSGYSEHQVDSIIEQNPSLSVMHLSTAIPYRNTTLLQDQDLTKQQIDLVVGEGLPLYQLDRMGNSTFEYIPSPLPAGVVQLSIEENYLPNRKGTITGTYNNKQGESRIQLHGPAEVEDSIIVEKKGQSRFSLSFVPRQPGNFTYTLTVRDGSGTHREAVPIHVVDEQKLNILFLQYFPTFESQYLKTYLAKENHKMTLRFQLSKNNFRHEFINQKGTSFTRLSEQLLSRFDLVIADGASLSALSAQENLSLEKSVKAGLGLLILPPIEKTPKIFFPFATVSTKKDTSSVRLSQKSFVLPTSQMRVKKSQLSVPILSNQSGLLSGYTFDRAGKIGFQLLHETYRLSLAGDSLHYAEIWTPVLEKIARRKNENSKIKIVTPFPWYENEPLEIEVISASEKITLLDDSIQVPLSEDIYVDNVWHGRTWASRKGWHILKTDAGTVKPYYIQSRPAWNALSTANQIRINGFRNGKNVETSSDVKMIMKDVPPAFFYLALTVAAGFIWLAPRL